MCAGKRDVVIGMEILGGDSKLETRERYDFVDYVDNGFCTWNCKRSMDEIVLHIDNDESWDETRCRAVIDGYGRHDCCSSSD